MDSGGKTKQTIKKKKKKKPPLPHLLFHCINNKKTPNQTQEVWFQGKFQEKTDKKCYILFLTFLSTSTANFCRLLGYMVTQPRPSCVKLGYLESKDVVRPKYYFIRSGISTSTLQSVAAPHHTPFPFQSKSGSSHMHSEHSLSYHSKWTLAASARLQHTEEQE